MNKTVFIFPGQGSQAVGMASALFNDFSSAKELLQESDEILKTNLSKLIIEGPAEELNKTENTQPALLLVSTAFAKIFAEKGAKPKFVAGHSLGEYSALVFNGALNYAEALQTVRLRGRYMQEAVPLGVGGMSAILGLNDEAVEEVCQTISQEGEIVAAANYNCPGQLVIAGHLAALAKAEVACKEKGAKLCKRLPVSAPFHCQLLKPAADQLASQLENIGYNEINIPYFANVDALASSEKESVKEKLVAQVVSPVRWKQTLLAMIEEGVERFIEVGPGKVLSGLVKKTNREVTALNIDNPQTMEQLF